MNHENYMRNNERYDSEAIIDDLCNLINKLKNHENIDDYVEWMEFRIFLVYLRQYFEYYVMFCRTDLTGDHKVDINEFKLALPTLEKWGVKIANPESEFKKIDKNGGGVIMFDEFCEYAINKNLDLEDDDELREKIVEKAVSLNKNQLVKVLYDDKSSKDCFQRNHV